MKKWPSVPAEDPSQLARLVDMIPNVKDRDVAEGEVLAISTWLTAALSEKPPPSRRVLDEIWPGDEEYPVHAGGIEIHVRWRNGGRPHQYEARDAVRALAHVWRMQSGKRATISTGEARKNYRKSGAFLDFVAVLIPSIYEANGQKAPKIPRLVKSALYPRKTSRGD